MNIVDLHKTTVYILGKATFVLYDTMCILGQTEDATEINETDVNKTTNYCITQ